MDEGQKRDLHKLAHFLNGLTGPRRQAFDIGSINGPSPLPEESQGGHGCQTSACVAGWAQQLFPQRFKASEVVGFDYVRRMVRAFGLEYPEAYELCNVSGYFEDGNLSDAIAMAARQTPMITQTLVTPQDAARKIEQILEKYCEGDYVSRLGL